MNSGFFYYHSPFAILQVSSQPTGRPSAENIQMAPLVIASSLCKKTRKKRATYFLRIKTFYTIR
jgi:hypothetical protein